MRYSIIFVPDKGWDRQANQSWGEKKKGGSNKMKKPDKVAHTTHHDVTKQYTTHTPIHNINKTGKKYKNAKYKNKTKKRLNIFFISPQIPCLTSYRPHLK